MVAEKPSLAQSLAKILSNGSSSFRKGSNGACSIHEWDGRFQGGNVLFRMTSVCGHVMTCDFPPRYNNWDKVDPVSYQNITFDSYFVSSIMLCIFYKKSCCLCLLVSSFNYLFDCPKLLKVYSLSIHGLFISVTKQRIRKRSQNNVH